LLADEKQLLIDVHTHLFNATDIPPRSFLKIVVLDHYPEQGTERLLDFGAPDTADWLITLFVWIVAGRAPTAHDEIAYLSGRGGSDKPGDVNASAILTKERLGSVLKPLVVDDTE
jgi:hypothetical protein